MKRLVQGFLLALAIVLLAACGTGGKRISTPATAIQQLTVKADGNWSVDVRLHNYSSVSMRFDSLRLKVSVDEHEAGTLAASPALSIGPTSADVVTVVLHPDPMARLTVADALAGRRSLAYRLEGEVVATPDGASKPRTFQVDDRSSLNPAPGLDGVLR